MIFFTADTHFGHANMMRFSPKTRGHFNNVGEVDEKIVSNWNSVISEDDTVYHLGDFAFCNSKRAKWLLYRLNGTMFYIRGNHDKKQILRILSDKAIDIRDYYELKLGKIRISLSHYPFSTWNGCHRGSWHLHGHEHGNSPLSSRKIMDVGMDANNLMPYSLDDIEKIMNKRESIKHHNRIKEQNENNN